MKLKLFFVLLITIISLQGALAAGNVTETASGAVNFETKKAEIIEVLALNEKQQVKAEKKYSAVKEKIAALNAEIVDKQQKAKMVKLSKIDTRTQLERLMRLNGELETLYQKRDRLHNKALRDFEKILNKDQKKTWQAIKLQGGRYLPELDSITTQAE